MIREEAIKVGKEPCYYDVISRKAVIKTVHKHLLNGTVAMRIIDEIKDSINALPSVQPKIKTGKWRAVYQGDEIIDYRCSECEFGNTFGKGTHRMNYCPNCGAMMESE